MTNDEFIMFQALPLELKVAKTKQRIREFVDKFGIEGVYVSFSGGKDSTVLLDIVKSMYPNIEVVFVDTGLEYPEIREFVKTFENVTTLRPRMGFREVIEKYGYPVYSKEQSRYIYDIKTSKSQKLINIRLHGSDKGHFRLSRKNYYLLDAPFKISNKCCDVMKKNPLRNYYRKNNKHPIMGMLADESALRKVNYLKTGCNAFNSTKPTSNPLGFWREQDILEYIYVNKLPIASVYGEVVYEDGIYKTTGVKRTGCVYCLYGIHKEETPNRIQQLKITHPKLYEYCLTQLGLKEVLEYIGVDYE